VTDGTGNLPSQVIECVRRALDEDIGPGDLTTNNIAPVHIRTQAQIITKQAGVIAGLDVAQAVFLQLDHEFVFTANVSDGEHVESGQILAELFGSARALLSGERTALNFIGRMSGIATLTRQFVDAVAGTRAVILDTRKTAPGLRAVDKLAVRRAGGQNHRTGLYDMLLIKDNHIELAGSLAEAVRRIRESDTDRRAPGSELQGTDSDRQGRKEPHGLEVEVRTLAGLREALALGVQRIMLDNMPIDLMREAVEITDGRVNLEASGNVTLENVRQIAESGVDFISVGALTHSPKSFDVSLKLATSENQRMNSIN
jgi:nicotinate-nucleotide pyrophosphorylase (carboxylating)